MLRVPKKMQPVQSVPVDSGACSQRFLLAPWHILGTRLLLRRPSLQRRRIIALDHMVEAGRPSEIDNVPVFYVVVVVVVRDEDPADRLKRNS